MVGAWELSNAERNRTCTATFKNTRAAVGWRVEFDKNCATVFPLIATAAGWTFPEGDLLRLLDADGRTLTEFSEVEDGIYEAPTPGIGVLFLQNPEAAARKPEDAPEPERIEDPAARCCSCRPREGGDPYSAASPSSCPALCRASTSLLHFSRKDVDGRDKPGHDGLI